MASSHAVGLNSSSAMPSLRRTVEKYFYLFMSVLIAIVVVYGFSLTIPARLFHPAIQPPKLVWVHGAVFFAWLGIYIAQSALVRVRKVQIHRRLGWWFAGVGVIIPILGVSITHVMTRFEIASLHLDAMQHIYALPIPLLDMVAFTAAFVPAILLRKRPEYHRRLILIAACTLTAAAWGRTPLDPPILSFYAGVDFLIVLGMLRDLYMNRRIHVAYLWYLPPYIVLQAGVIYVFADQPSWWLPLGQSFLGKIG